MEVRPVKHYRQPRYPTNRILEQHPELLRLVPKRWQGNPLVITALTGLCILMAGCRAGGQAASHVAPIFVHGAGRGGFGCVAVNPPVVLSEAEAHQVIVEEAKKSGIDLKPGVQTALNTDLDGPDPRRLISYEFTSSKDTAARQRRSFWNRSSAYTLDCQAEANRFRDRLAKARPAGSYGVFYDPFVKPRRLVYTRGSSGSTDSKAWVAERKSARDAAKIAAKEEVREQVKDFIKWLKAEGVI